MASVFFMAIHICVHRSVIDTYFRHMSTEKLAMSTWKISPHKNERYFVCTHTKYMTCAIIFIHDMYFFRPIFQDTFILSCGWTWKYETCLIDINASIRCEYMALIEHSLVTHNFSYCKFLWNFNMKIVFMKIDTTELFHHCIAFIFRFRIEACK